MIKKVLVICATSGELKTVKNEILNIKSLEKSKVRFDFLLSGIGNYETIYSLGNYLEKERIDFILNIGICGYKKEKQDLEINEIINKDYSSKKYLIQISRIYNLSQKKEILVPIFLHFAKLESIACSEKIIYNPKKIGEENFVDMESFGIEFVAQKYKIPRILLKVPIDKIGKETKNFDYKMALEKLKNSINYEDLVKKISSYLLEKTPEINLEKYINNFNFTFSQKIIFQKLYFKYKSLIGNNFEDFFIENKKLDRKTFLIKLEKILEKGNNI